LTEAVDHPSDIPDYVGSDIISSHFGYAMFGRYPYGVLQAQAAFLTDAPKHRGVPFHRAVKLI